MRPSPINRCRPRLPGALVVNLCWLFLLSAKTRNRPTAEQRAIDALAYFLERNLAQAEEFTVQNGKGVEEREGDDFYPQQAQNRHRLMMGTMGQVPVLS